MKLAYELLTRIEHAESRGRDGLYQKNYPIALNTANAIGLIKPKTIEAMPRRVQGTKPSILQSHHQGYKLLGSLAH